MTAWTWWTHRHEPVRTTLCKALAELKPLPEADRMRVRPYVDRGALNFERLRFARDKRRA